MGFRRKLQYLLVHLEGISNKEAKRLISEGKVSINRSSVFENTVVHDHEDVYLSGRLIRPSKNYVVWKYYKPVGKVSSLHPEVKDSLYDRFKNHLPLCIAGRLDKNSEGLLLLTNHGKWAQEMTHPLFEKKKTYHVITDKPLNDEFLKNMREGMIIMGINTKPAECRQLDTCMFEICLTEGKNRQIRRMCRKQGFRVTSLKRIAVDRFHLHDLKPDESEMLNFS